MRFLRSKTFSVPLAMLGLTLCAPVHGQQLSPQPLSPLVLAPPSTPTEILNTPLLLLHHCDPQALHGTALQVQAPDATPLCASVITLDVVRLALQLHTAGLRVLGREDVQWLTEVFRPSGPPLAR